MPTVIFDEKGGFKTDNEVLTSALSSDVNCKNNIPAAPQNFYNIPRYISNLPLDRVKEIRKWALSTMDSVAYYDTHFAKAIGFILELTNLNNEQK